MMKSNLFLIVLLGGLLSFAYFFQEVKQKETIKANNLKRKMFKEIDKIVELKTNKYHFVKTNNSWIEKNKKWPLDDDAIKEILKILESVMMSSTLVPKKGEDYFSDEVTFSLKADNKWSFYKLGSISKATGVFYIGKENDSKVYLCLDKSVFDVVYSSEKDLNLKKYYRLKQIFSLDEEIYLEQNIFWPLELGELSTLRVHTRPKIEYELDFQKKSSLPKAFENVHYHNFLEVLNFSMEQTKIKKVITSGQHLLEGPLSKVWANEKEYTLYSSLNKKRGNFLKAKEDDFLLELSLGPYNIFYIHYQDYWLKKHPFKVDMTKLKEVHFKLRKGADLVAFYIKNLESFEVLTKSPRVNFIGKAQMNFLFNLLLNLADFKEAKYIEKGQSFDKESLEMYIFNKLIKIKITESQIIVYFEKENLSFFYSLSKLQIAPRFFDKIFTMKKNEAI